MLKIDSEIKSLIVPLTGEEHAQLEANIVSDGCIDPIVVWKDCDVILDGHNRYEICERLGVGYRTVELDLANKNAVKEWVIRHQLGRRNLSPMQRAEYALLLKPVIAEKASQRKLETQFSEDASAVGNKCSPPVKSGKNEDFGKTTEIVAKAAGVSSRVIKETEKIITKATPALQKAARSGAVSVHAASQAADLPAKQQDAVAAGEITVKEAVAQVAEPDIKGEPWDTYNDSLDSHAKAIESIARGISDTAEFDADHNAKCEFAKGHLHHAGTVGQLRQIKRALQESKITGKNGARYIIKRESDHTDRVAKARKGAHNDGSI